MSVGCTVIGNIFKEMYAYIESLLNASCIVYNFIICNVFCPGSKHIQNITEFFVFALTFRGLVETIWQFTSLGACCTHVALSSQSTHVSTEHTKHLP